MANTTQTTAQMTEPVFSSVTELEKKGHRSNKVCRAMHNASCRWITVNSPFSVPQWGTRDMALALVRERRHLSHLNLLLSLIT